MNYKVRLSLKLTIFLSVIFTCTSILMLNYFLGEIEGLSEDARMFYIRAYAISVAFWPIIGFYSFLRLNGMGHKIIDEAFEIAATLIANGYGLLFNTLLPLTLLLDIESLSFFQRLAILFFFIIIWSTVLYYIMKIRKRKKSDFPFYYLIKSLFKKDGKMD